MLLRDEALNNELLLSFSGFLEAVDLKGESPALNGELSLVLALKGEKLSDFLKGDVFSLFEALNGESLSLLLNNAFSLLELDLNGESLTAVDLNGDLSSLLFALNTESVLSLLDLKGDACLERDLEDLLDFRAVDRTGESLWD